MRKGKALTGFSHPAPRTDAAVQRGPGSVQRGLRCIFGPNSVQRGPGSVQRGPSLVQRGPGLVQRGPGSVQHGLRLIFGPGLVQRGLRGCSPPRWSFRYRSIEAPCGRSSFLGRLRQSTAISQRRPRRTHPRRPHARPRREPPRAVGGALEADVWGGRVRSGRRGLGLCPWETRLVPGPRSRPLSENGFRPQTVGQRRCASCSFATAQRTPVTRARARIRAP